MATTTKTQVQNCYIETSLQNFVPINIIPSDLIKCTHCNTYIPYRQLDAHNDTFHVTINNSHGIKTGQGSGQRAKINLSVMLNQPNSNQTEIAVRSILPEQLPGIELIKKQAFVRPSGLEGKTKKMYINSISNRIPSNLISDPLQKNTEQQLLDMGLMSQPQEIEQQQTLHFKKYIPFSPKSFLFEQKNLQVYTNQKPMQSGSHINQRVLPSKRKILQQENKKQQKQNESYTIERIKLVSQTKKKHASMKVNINTTARQPVLKQKISTFSTSGSQGFASNFAGIYKSNENNTDSDDNTDEGERVVGHAYNFQCQACHGFYCKTCGSDIPPQFRPVPKNLSSMSSNFNLTSQNQTNVNASAFYASHVFNKSMGKTSRVTGCTNCQ